MFTLVSFAFVLFGPVIVMDNSSNTMPLRISWIQGDQTLFKFCNLSYVYYL